MVRIGVTLDFLESDFAGQLCAYRVLRDAITSPYAFWYPVS
jgi:hypothetical protein